MPPSKNMASIEEYEHENERYQNIVAQKRDLFESRESLLGFIREIEDMIVPVDEQPYKLPNNWVWVKLDNLCSKITDGTTQESLYYGDILKFNVATSKEANNELLKLLLPIRKKGKPIFVINYGKGEKKRILFTT